jgi:hypothetical protein
VLTYATTFHPGTVRHADAAVIELASGESRAGVDILIAYSRARRVSGVVTGPSGPVADLLLRLLPADSGSMLISRPVGVAAAVTDSNGMFTFPAVTPGEYQLSTALFPRSEREATASETGMLLWASESLAVGDVDVTGLTVALRRGIHISGRVHFANATGRALQQGQSVRVGLRPLGAGRWASPSAYPEPNGSFTITGAPPGRYAVSASITCTRVGGCPTTWRLETTTVEGRPLPFDVVELESADVSDLVLTFSERTTRVSGSIVDESDRPVTNPGADIVAFPADTTLWKEDTLNYRRVRQVHAMSTGAFEIEGLAPGDYYLVAVETGYPVDDARALERLIPGASRLTLGAGQQANQRLHIFNPQGR